MEYDISWWRQLSPEWKNAFAETFFRHHNEPTPGELAQLSAGPALRFAGPTAPYPNMSFELKDLSGIAHLTHLEVLVVTHHHIQTISEVKTLPRLKALYLFNNQLKSLEGIESLDSLEQLYVQGNQIESIEPVRGLTNLRELYVHDNRLSSLEGLTEEHAEKLEGFFCKPNEGLKQKEVMRVERELYIRCRNI
jgi:Leucine-rich repeat (LRR) protein